MASSLLLISIDFVADDALGSFGHDRRTVSRTVFGHRVSQLLAEETGIEALGHARGDLIEHVIGDRGAPRIGATTGAGYCDGLALLVCEQRREVFRHAARIRRWQRVGVSAASRLRSAGAGWIVSRHRN